MKPVVLGLDLSLRQTGACILPTETINDRSTWQFLICGKSLEDTATPKERTKRLIETATRLVWFARTYGVTDVFVEDYAYSASKSRAHSIGELGGTVKSYFLAQLNMPLRPVPASQARSHTFGKLPRKDGKKYAHEIMEKNGLTFNTLDEGDAFIIANFGVMDMGHRGFIFG